DAVSWLILTEDLERLLEAMLQGRRPELPAKSSSYAAWARALHERAQMPKDEDVACWLESDGAEAAAQLPLARTIESAGEPHLAPAQRSDGRWQPGGGAPHDALHDVAPIDGALYGGGPHDSELGSAERWLSPKETAELLG
ncbi:hypothetical protein, partial [Paenibacillus sp. 598K]|uniref:hypothetical protein n=1 Tax=Paenibacillus sp. 598K TaxID=1117987 RepID=UPI001C872CF8